MKSSDATSIRILVVDDHTLFRRGLTALLARDPQLQVVGDAADAGQALRKAQELQPDVILLDNHLPGVNGVDAVPSLLDMAPNSCILMLTVSEDENDLLGALQGGASGYLLKNMEGDALTSAVHRAAQGDSIIAPEMMGKLVAAYKGASTRPSARAEVEQLAVSPNAHELAMASLSPRELDILRGIARGASNKEIAREYGIVETTVKIHVQHILRKLGVSSRVHAAVMASGHGVF
jgi:two-component system, NarL family, nitrate/nitrite response regulator NarL